MEKELICLGCPMGCALSVKFDSQSVLSVYGNQCPKGVEYAKSEIFNPLRMVSTTVRLKGAAAPFLPVRTESPAPKGMSRKIVEAASKITVHAPVVRGAVVLENAAGSGVSLVACATFPGI